MEKLLRKEVVKTKEEQDILEKDFTTLTKIKDFERHINAADKFVMKACNKGNFELALKAAKENEAFADRYYREEKKHGNVDDRTPGEIAWDNWLLSGARTPPPDTSDYEDGGGYDRYLENLGNIVSAAADAGNIDFAFKVLKDIEKIREGDKKDPSRLIALFDIINGVAKKGDFELAMKLAKELPADAIEIVDTDGYEGFTSIVFAALDRDNLKVALDAVKKIKNDEDGYFEALIGIQEYLEEDKKISPEEKKKIKNWINKEMEKIGS